MTSPRPVTLPPVPASITAPPPAYRSSAARVRLNVGMAPRNGDHSAGFERRPPIDALIAGNRDALCREGDA